MGRREAVEAFLSNPDEAPLAEDVSFTRLRSVVSGRQAVLNEVRGGAAAQAYGLVQWSEPAEIDDFVRVVGEAPPNEITGQITLQFYFSGDRIHRIQHQALLPRPAFQHPIVLPQAVKDVINGALADGRPFAIAHVDEDNTPVQTYRGSLTVIGDDQVAIWVRDANGGFIRAISKNPHVAAIYRNSETHGYYNLKGRARVADDEGVRALLQAAIPAAERLWDPAATGVPVVIDLDRVEGWSGSVGGGPNVRVNMQRG